MNTETKARIAALDDDAPNTAVVAAWADMGEILWEQVAPKIKAWRYKKSHMAVGEFLPDANGNGYLNANDERTLRQWLLDGGVEVTETLERSQYVSLFTVTSSGRPDDESYIAYADSPEAAFQSAIAKFAETLRQEVAK